MTSVKVVSHHRFGKMGERERKIRRRAEQKAANYVSPEGKAFVQKLRSFYGQEPKRDVFGRRPATPEEVRRVIKHT